MSVRHAILGAVLLLGSSGFAGVFADTGGLTPPGGNSDGPVFPGQKGEAIYRGICQGCHMEDAAGAIGAGRYPSLKNNSSLQISGYVASMVVKGNKAMPAFAIYLTDTQVAEVVNYVRSHFGNHYRDPIKPEDIRPLR